MPTKQKKSSVKKSVPVKKKTLAPKKTVATPVIREAVQPEVKKETKITKVYEISAFFHALIVIIVVVLYAEIAFLSVIYFNYDVRIESKPLITMQQPVVRTISRRCSNK